MARFTKSNKKSSTRKKEEVRSLGVFYTPLNVAEDSIMPLTGLLDTKKASCSKVSVLDPSFGDGVFLHAVKNTFKESSIKFNFYGSDISSESSHIRTSIPQKNLRTRSNSLLSAWVPAEKTFLPINHTIINVPGSKKTLSPSTEEIKYYSKVLKTPTKRKRLNEVCNIWLAAELSLISISKEITSNWDESIQDHIEGYSIFSKRIVEESEKYSLNFRFFHWQVEFHNIDKGFDLIVGNPPWEVIEKQPNELNSFLPEEKEYAKFVKKVYEVPNGRRVELAAAFTRLTQALLSQKGILHLLLPQALVSSKTFKPTREIAFQNSATFQRYDNGTGVFTNLDKRCDFIGLTLKSSTKPNIRLLNTIFTGKQFLSDEISLMGASINNLKKLTGPELLIPNLKTNQTKKIIFKILKNCKPLEQLDAEYDTWNGLNSTTDRHLISANSKSSLPVFEGADIYALTELFKASSKKTKSKYVCKEEISKRGFSNLFGSPLWKRDRIAWRKISRLDDTRTIISTPLKANIVNMESLWTIAFADEELQEWLEFFWSTTIFDVMARTVVNSNISKFILLGLPVPEIHRPTLNAFKKLKTRFKNISHDSVNYYLHLREIDKLCFKLFGLSGKEQEILWSSFYNRDNPKVQMLSGGYPPQLQLNLGVAA